MQDFDLIQRLHSAESDLLTSLTDDTQILVSYHQTWSALPGQLLSMLRNGSVGHETLSLAHLVASRISKIANCFLDIKRDEELFTAQLQSDCDAMLHQMARLNINEHSYRKKASDLSHSSGSSNIPASDAEGPSSLVVSAYQWLLDNLHNPYPSSDVKTRIAIDSSCQVSSVNSWFTNARRRIGWTALCREYFANCRADMTDAAYRALVEEDPRRILSPELRHTFVAMKVAAEGLYSSSFTRSIFSGDLDGVMGNTMNECKESVASGKVEGLSSRKGAEHSYPSPVRSIESCPVPGLDNSPTNESEENEDVAPPVVAGSKRRRSSLEPVNQLSSIAERPIKRLRASKTSQAHLPSPPSSTDGIELSSDVTPPRLSSKPSTGPKTNEILTSRKRYVSHMDDPGTPRRLGVLANTPTFSDPLAHLDIGSESIEDWFNTNSSTLFAIPPPVDAVEPDFSTSWEVELFSNYCIPESLKFAPKGPLASITDTYASATTSLYDFDNLLQSFTNDPSVIPSGGVLPPNIIVDPPAPFFDASILDPSQDWTSLLTGSDAYQPTIGSMFSQYTVDTQPLPEIDLSMLQLPPVIPDATQSSDDLALKRAKLDELHAMQEAVRRMEQELQSEGVLA